MTQRLNYRTPDGIIHLWTQEEIDAHIQACNTPIQVEQMGHVTPLFEDDPVSVQEEALLTIDMLYGLLHHRRPRTLDHETTQDLLSRIDVMCEPLKAMVQVLEVPLTPQEAEAREKGLRLAARLEQDEEWREWLQVGFDQLKAGDTVEIEVKP